MNTVYWMNFCEMLKLTFDTCFLLFLMYAAYSLPDDVLAFFLTHLLMLFPPGADPDYCTREDVSGASARALGVFVLVHLFFLDW